MRFLVDAQLPPALARWIAAQGHVAEHVASALAPTEPDAAIVHYAIANGAVIITKDSDFL
jgi:predicted nuclease of predicted toxin-antitoxin system